MNTLMLAALQALTAVSPGQALPVPGSPQALIAIDGRPAIQKKEGFESSPTGCTYGILRIGDKRFGGDRVAALATVITANFPSLAGKRIVVRNYAIHHNMAIESKRMAGKLGGAMIGGAIGGMLMSSGEAPDSGKVVGCSAEDVLGGYTTGEAGVLNSPVITVIDLQFDNRNFHFRSVSDTYMKGDQGLKRRELGEANLKRAQAEMISRFIPAFEAFLTPPAEAPALP